MVFFKNNCLARILITAGLFVSFNTFSNATSQYASCIDQPEKQISRSNELKELVDADQNERVDFENLSEEDRLKLSENDLNRRKRVGEVFGEGCFKTSGDYAAAALIYQHGDVPDHYFQAFIWANRAVQLGDLNQKSLGALAIDRYLFEIGKKQLFGSQAYASEIGGWCYCLVPVEPSFPDSFRKEYSGASLEERFEWLASINQGKNCPNNECPDFTLQPSPKGTVPGFW